MSLQLPPPRRLPDPDRVLDAILDDELANRRRRSPHWLGSLVAAAVVLIIVAVGYAVFSARNQPQVADPPVAPSTGVSPSRAVTVPPAGPTTEPTSTSGLDVGGSATFEDFSVTVMSVKNVDGIGYFVQAAVCVRQLPATPTGSTTRISWDPWSLVTSTGVERPDGRIQQPADLPRFSAEVFRHVGECEQGWLPFGGSARTSPVTSVSYRNELEDRAQWLVNPVHSGPRPPTKIGDTLGFPYLKVTVGDPIRSGGLYASYVKTCVTALPPGTPSTGVLLRRGSWSLTTSAGKVTIDDPIKGAIPLPTTYPDSGRYRVGECAFGYVPFGIEVDAEVTSVDYRNAFGDQAAWRADS